MNYFQTVELFIDLPEAIPTESTNDFESMSENDKFHINVKFVRFEDSQGCSCFRQVVVSVSAHGVQFGDGHQWAWEKWPAQAETLKGNTALYLLSGESCDLGREALLSFFYVFEQVCRATHRANLYALISKDYEKYTQKLIIKDHRNTKIEKISPKNFSCFGGFMSALPQDHHLGLTNEKVNQLGRVLESDAHYWTLWSLGRTSSLKVDTVPVGSRWWTRYLMECIALLQSSIEVAYTNTQKTKYHKWSTSIDGKLRDSILEKQLRTLSRTRNKMLHEGKELYRDIISSDRPLEAEDCKNFVKWTFKAICWFEDNKNTL